MDDIKQDIKVIRESQIRMEEDIKHHIKRTDLLEELHKDNEKRIINLEEDKKFKAKLKSGFLECGKLLGVILAAIALYNAIKGALS